MLDALRGFALLGVCLANYKELTLYAFYDVSHTTNVAAAGGDGIASFLLNFLVDGKFYTIFSVLFGIGFSIIISNALARGANGMRIFYRRMLALLGFGMAHMLLLWSGDILMLYAAMGMLLPLFWNCQSKTLLRWAGLMLFLPVISQTLVWTLHLSPGTWFYAQMDYWQQRFGIGDWGEWLRSREHYSDLLKFLVMGAFERMTEFIASDRYFKVLGLFLLGLWIGKERICAAATSKTSPSNTSSAKTLFSQEELLRAMKIGYAVGVPFALIHAADAAVGYRLVPPLSALVELLSIYPMGLAYMATFAFLGKESEAGKIQLAWCRHLFRMLQTTGRMALTCYIGQSLLAVVLFYGVGFGLGMRLTLPGVILSAVAVFLAETAFAYFWLRRFTYGPLEWIWRMLTYRKWIRLRDLKSPK